MADNKEDSTNKNQDQPEKQSAVKPNDQANKTDQKSAKAAPADKHTEEITKLKKTVVELQKKFDDMENRYLRAEADMKNIQNHAKKEQADLIKYDGQQLAHDILPIVDNLQRALEVEATDDNSKQLKKGVSMVYEHLNKALKDNGIEIVDALNKPFDPKFEQAIQTAAADDDHPAETVVQVLQDGYRLKDRVLRPAMVVVAK